MSFLKISTRTYWFVNQQKDFFQRAAVVVVLSVQKFHSCMTLLTHFEIKPNQSESLLCTWFTDQTHVCHVLLLEILIFIRFFLKGNDVDKCYFYLHGGSVHTVCILKEELVFSLHSMASPSAIFAGHGKLRNNSWAHLFMHDVYMSCQTDVSPFVLWFRYKIFCWLEHAVLVKRRHFVQPCCIRK